MDKQLKELIEYYKNNQNELYEILNGYKDFMLEDMTATFNIIDVAGGLTIEVFTKAVDSTSEFYEEEKSEEALNIAYELAYKFLRLPEEKSNFDKLTGLSLSLAELMEVYDIKEHIDYEELNTMYQIIKNNIIHCISYAVVKSYGHIDVELRRQLEANRLTLKQFNELDRLRAKRAVKLKREAVK